MPFSFVEGNLGDLFCQMAGGGGSGSDRVLLDSFFFGGRQKGSSLLFTETSDARQIRFLRF